MIRRAVPDDAPVLAQLHVSVWRETYADIAPSEALAKLDAEHRLLGWKSALADLRRATFVAEIAGDMVGFVHVGPASDPVFAGRGEIKHLYVAGPARGQKLGQRLMQQGAAFLRSDFQEVALAVVEQNAKARAFYARLGGREVAKFKDAGPLWPSDNILVVWDRSFLDRDG